MLAESLRSIVHDVVPTRTEDDTAAAPAEAAG